MATSLSADVTVNASPDEVLAAVAALEDYPKWSDTHKKFTVVTRDEAGRPTEAQATVLVGGNPDQQVISYVWTENSVNTNLVKSASGSMKSQRTSYTVTPSGTGAKLTFEITVDPSIPAPGFLVKKALKKVVTNATENLKRHIESN